MGQTYFCEDNGPADQSLFPKTDSERWGSSEKHYLWDPNKLRLVSPRSSSFYFYQSMSWPGVRAYTSPTWSHGGSFMSQHLPLCREKRSQSGTGVFLVPSQMVVDGANWRHFLMVVGGWHDQVWPLTLSTGRHGYFLKSTCDVDPNDMRKDTIDMT